MESISMALLVIGIVVSLIGGIWFLIVAFTESILWGLAVFFVPLVGLFFLGKHWDRAKIPFLIQLVGTMLIFGGAYLSPDPEFLREITQ